VWVWQWAVVKIKAAYNLVFLAAIPVVCMTYACHATLAARTKIGIVLTFMYKDSTDSYYMFRRFEGYFFEENSIIIIICIRTFEIEKIEILKMVQRYDSY